MPGPSCALFDGWLISDSKNNLSPASKAKGTRLCVSARRGRGSSYSPLRGCGDAAWGLTQGDGPRLTGGVGERPSVKGGGQ